MAHYGITIEENNIPETLSAVDKAVWKAFEMIGIKIEKYAKALCPTGTSASTGKKGYRGGTLKNSITHEIYEDSGPTLAVGTNVEYAPYVELGTGPYFETPPEWEQFGTKRGSTVKGSYVKPRAFLRPAITDHLNEYNKIIEDQLFNW